jgi:trimethylamine--corrinoid protein Co-methyltransferase
MTHSRKSQCLDAIRHQILSLALPPGSDLDEAKLGAEFGMSRTPLREVLQKLAGEGFVDITQNKGAKVVSMDMAVMRSFFQTAPLIYGHYLATVSMRSGVPMAGTPEISLMNFMIGQMARQYNVPWRTSNTLGGAKVLDAQAGYESAMTLNAVLMAGANYIWHSAGWNEAGMHCSMSKFVVDAELCAMGYRMAEGIRWDDFDAAMQAVRDIGPGGHYLGHSHTLENFQRAFFMPEMFDNNSIEQWQADGALDTNTRGLIRARQMLDEYEEPKLDPGIDEALGDYIARREREIPAADALNQEY